MARPRKPKKPRIARPQEAVPTEPGPGEEDALANTRARPFRSRVTDREASDVKAEIPPVEWCEQNVAFCCAVCECSKEKRDQAIGDPNDPYPFIFSRDDSLSHRICCHEAFNLDDREWAPCHEEKNAEAQEALLDIEKLKQLPSSS